MALLLAGLSPNPVVDLEQMTEFSFMVNALWAGTVVAVMAGAIGWFMVLRRQTFAGHTLAVIAFPGAAGATLAGLPLALGYFGTCGLGALLLALFLFLLVMCFTVAFFARDALGRLIVAGIIALLFAHIFEHIGMNIVLLPITGIPLPFISYGGTFLIMIMSLMGLMQSVWVHRNKMLEEEAARRPALTPRTAPAIA